MSEKVRPFTGPIWWLIHFRFSIELGAVTPDNQDERKDLGAALRASALSPLRSDRTRKRFRPIRVTISA